MCFALAIAFAVAAWNFYDNGFITHTIISLTLAVIMLGVFFARTYIHRKCIFGNGKDCKKDNVFKIKK